MNRSDGFTLIEIVAATAVLIVILLGVASMSLAASGQLSRSGEQTTATVLGQQRIEWLRNQGYSSADLAAGTVTELLQGDHEGFTRTTVVQDNTPVTGIKQVTVTTLSPKGLAVTVVTLVAP
jgi:type IV pilus assembly protein PilV